jgi:putative photosynthetic complex assembly protein
MTDSALDRPFPRSLLLGAAALIGLALIGIVAVRAMGLGTGSPPPGPAVMSRDLFFVDRADGGVDVLDGEATAVARLAPGTNGFLRATLRGLVRERRRNGLGAESPFRLTAHADGRLTLQDAATGRLVDLEAFGATNAGAFAALLRPRPDA